MPVSFATVDASKMELTPCKVSFKGPGASAFADIGGTSGNVTVKMKFDKAEIRADQFGKSVLDRRVSGVMATIETEITEVLNKDAWKIVFPHAKKLTDSVPTVPLTVIDFTSMIGDSDLSNAGELLLHPLSRAATDTEYDVYAWKACASAESEITYSPEGQMKLKIVWNILIDTTTTPARLIRYGSKDAAVTY